MVHGGYLYTQPVVINPEVLINLKKFSKFSPLHSQPSISGIEEMQKILSGIPHVAVFDTALHETMPPKAFLYGIAAEYTKNYHIRRYGFHGINHSYVQKKALQLQKIISCHLGNGCSITAFKDGKSIDNSMGLTPLEGLVMGTRCGDLDPSIVIFLQEELKMPPSLILEMLNKKSGLLGLCGKSDMRDILDAAKRDEAPAKIALEVFVYRIQKTIGAYAAVLNGVDGIIFTGGIGENSPEIRHRILKNFSYLGVKIDDEKNQSNSLLFSQNSSSVALMCIPANEELEIAHAVYHKLFDKH